jgi:quinone-modifying oxidoreductase subunit QmoA
VTGYHPIDDSTVEKLSSERPNDFNLAMDKTKALYWPNEMAYPPVYVLDRDALSDADASLLSDTCTPGTVDLGMKVKEFEVDAGAIIVATGWQPYDATRLDNLGFGKYPNVITNVMMERLAARNGPTSGEIIRPSDRSKAQNVAFAQCAGSRDENHLPYCSAVCCMASMKEVRLLRECNEESRATIFYIDIRAVGREEKFYYDMLEDENVSFVKGKVARIALATGMVPNTIEARLPFKLEFDDHGFIDGTTDIDGVYAAGCATRPCDVSRSTKQATAAALKAVQCLNRGE